MKKTMRSVLTLLLVVAMLFGVLAPTVAFATDGTESGGNGTEGSVGSVGGSYDAGWCVIEYDANELKITLDPDKESLLDMDKEKVKEMLNTVIDAAKTIVVDELKESIKDGLFGSEDDGGLGNDTTLDTVWQKVIDMYLSTVVELEKFDATERYLEFFKLALESPEKEEEYINELVDYACNLLENAVRFGMFTVEELEEFGEEKIKSTVDELFKDKVEELLESKVTGYVEEYITWVCDPENETLDLNADEVEFIDEEIAKFMGEVADKYLAGTLDKTIYVYVLISDYLDVKVDEQLKAHEAEIAETAKNTLDNYVNSYYTGNGTPESGMGAEIDGWIADEISKIVYEQFAGYVAHKYDGGAKPDFFDEIDAKIKEYAWFADSLTKEQLEAEIYDIDSVSNVKTVKTNVYNDAVKILFDEYKENKERFEELINDIVAKAIAEPGKFKEAVFDKNGEVDEILDSEKVIDVLHEILEGEDVNIVDFEKSIEKEILARTDFNAEHVEEGTFTDRVFEFVLGEGHGHDEFYDDHLVNYVDLFISDYLAVIDELKNEDQTVGIKDVIEYLDGVYVGAHGEELIQIYGNFGDGNYVISTEALKDLAKTLPTPSELANMDNDEMYWSYDFLIVTDFGSCDFRLTLDIEGGYNTIRRVSELVSRYLDVYVSSDGYYTVKLRVPAKFSELLLRACNTGRVSEETKNKIFSFLTYNVEDAYGLYSDKVTFENIIDLLEEINFEGLLDKEFISQFVDLSGLSNEDIVNKVKEYEGYFNKLNSIVKRVYNRIPDAYRDNEIMDYYGEDGLFGYKNTHTISYEKIEKAVMKVLPDYGATLLSFVDIGDGITAKVDLSVDFEDVNKIEYSLPDASEPYRVGLLPVGADVEMFAELTEYNGQKILYWYELDEMGNRVIVDKMPDKDVKLYPAVYGQIDGVMEMPEETDKPFDGEALKFTFDIGEYDDETYDVIYSWYKVGLTTFSLRARSQDILVKEGSENFLEITNVSESGSYYCKASVTKDGEVVAEKTSDVFNANIQPIEFEIGNLTWNSSEFLYNGEEREVYITNVPEYITVTYGGDVTAIGSPDADSTYVATATWILADGQLAENYIITVGGEEVDPVAGGELTHTWKIVIIVVDDTVEIPSDLEWNYTNPLEYNGEEQKVELILGASFPADVEVSYALDLANGITNKATDAGTYIAKAVFTSTEGKTVVCDVDYELEWTIAPKEIVFPVTEYTWNYRIPYTYSGTEYEVYLVEELPAHVKVVYTGDTKATNAGTYTAGAYFEVTDDNYAISVQPTVEALTWVINPMTVTLADIVWNYTGALTYNGEEQTVYVVGLPVGIEVAYSGVTAATNVGRYQAIATVTVTEGYEDNFNIVDTVATLDWQIDKLVIDLSDVDWDYSEAFVFNLEDQTVSLAGLSDELVEVLKKAGYSIVVEGNTAKNAGTYTATAKIIGVSDNCDAVGFSVADLEWTILKADFDMSGVSFPNKTVPYTGADVTVGIVGKLPAGIVVSYTADTTYRYMGRYEITAVFSLANPADPLVNYNNYNEIAPMTMVLTILSELQNDFIYRDDAGNPILSVGAENGIPKDHDFKVSDDSHVYTGFYITDERYGKVVSAYDISFSRGGVYMPVTDNFSVKILIPEDYRSSEALTVVYVSEDGKVEELQAQRVTEGSYEYVVFTTGHFSTYALVNIEDAPVKVLPADYSWIWILVVILVVLLLLVIVILLIIRKIRKNKGDEPKPTEPTDAPTEGTDEAVAEEPAAADEPVADAPVEVEPTREEPVAEEPAPEIVVVIGKDPEADAQAPVVIPDGDPVPVRYRHSFESKLIQAETDIQDYYTTIKNTLLSYKGVKARMSFNYEAFNKGRVQCAKLNLKGRTLMVYLNLNPADYNVNKYHFVDVSDKIKSEKDRLVMLMKVRSDRALGYTVELIEEMMKVLEIPAGETQTVDYHRPYEATEELAKRGLVKVILPAGMTLDENSKVVRVNVGDLLDSVSTDKSETPAEEATAVAEPVAEEPVMAPAEEAPAVASAPVVEEVVFTDAVHADEILSDEEAESHVEVIHTGASLRKGKLGEINLDTICANFDSGDTVNLAALKEKRLVGKNVARVKVLARGTMNRSLTVVASKFSMQAIKMIELAGGVVVIED